MIKEAYNRGKQEAEEANAVVPAAAGAAGLYGGYKLLNPRTTLHHGTSKDRAKKIVEEGLAPNKAPGISRILDENIASKPYVYATPKKMEAKIYAQQQEAINSYFKGKEIPKNILKDLPGIRVEMGAKIMEDPIQGIKDFILRKPVSMKIPMWKEEIASKVRQNPELLGATNWKDWAAKRKKGEMEKLYPKFIQDLMNQKLYKDLSRAKVFEGGIDPKYIVGSKKYQGVNPKEILEYAKAKPGKFGLGLGVGAAGLGLLGYGARNYFSEKKET